MNFESGQHDQQHLDLVFLYALRALPSSEVSPAETQIAGCENCRQELETLRPLVGSFVSWPADVLRPSESLWSRLAQRIGGANPKEPVVPPQQSPKPEWESAAPGISVQILSTDTENNRVSMLVRLAPGADYPPHCHAGVEELHLLYGELMIDEKRLYPGDYFRAEAGSVDHRVWSETGCTCVLLTSSEDLIL